MLNEKWMIDPEGETPVIEEYHENGPILKHPYDGHNLLEKSLRFAEAVEVIGKWELLCQQ